MEDRNWIGGCSSSQAISYADPTSQWTSVDQYETYLGLIGLAESLRSQGHVEESYKCLMAILGLQIPYSISARMYCEIGKLLLRESENFDLAQQFLDKAVEMCRMASAGSALEDIKLDAAANLAELYLSQNNVAQARDILHAATQQSQHLSYWQCHFIFHLAKVFMHGQDYSVATQILQLGEAFSVRHQAAYLNVLFQLAGAHVQMRSGQLQGAIATLQTILTNLDMQTAYVQPLLREHLRFYALSLEILCRLNSGQAKSVRNLVINLQNCSDSMAQLRVPNNPVVPLHQMEMFSVVEPDLAPVLLNALSVQFFGIIGYHDKLDRTFHRTMSYLDGLESLQQSPLQDALRLILYQEAIPASLTTGRFSQGLQQVNQFVSLSSRDLKSFGKRRTVTHLLLGMCAQQFGYYDVAESQLKMAACHCSSTDLLIVINLNLAVCYLKLGRYQDISAMSQQLNPQTLITENGSLRCASALLQSLTAFIEGRGTDFKAILRSIMPMTNIEDLNQMMAVALALMAKNCSAMGEYQDMLKVAKTGYDLAEKIPDQSLQIACLNSLKVGYGLMGDYANQTTAAATLNRFLHKEAQEGNIIRQSSDLNILRWTGETSASV